MQLRLAREHLPQRPVNTKAEPRFQIRIHGITDQTLCVMCLGHYNVQNTEQGQRPLRVGATCSSGARSGAQVRRPLRQGGHLAASPRQGRRSPHPLLRAPAEGLRPSGLSTLGRVPGGLSTWGPGGHPVSPSGARRGARARRPLRVRAGGHPVPSLGRLQWGSGPAEVTLPALLSSWLWCLQVVNFEPQHLGVLLGEVGVVRPPKASAHISVN